MDHLTEILVGLADHEVDFVVGGGVAAVLHGVERVTMDLDIAVRWEQQNLLRFLASMRALRLEPKMPVSPELLLDREIFDELLRSKGALVFSFRDPSDPIRLVDVFIKPELSFEVLAPDATTLSLQGRTIRVVSASRLSAIKQSIAPPRPKDELDISALKAILERRDD